MLRSIWMVHAVLGLFVSTAWAQSRYQPQPDPQTPAGIPYQRYFTQDRYKRRVTFYISNDNLDRKLPLVVVVLGSGPFSNFRLEGGRVVDAHGTIRRVFMGKAHVLAVEKPEVEFLEQPTHGGDFGLRGSTAFQSENTVPRWVEAISAAIYAARKLPQVDSSRALIIGHSEGALIAALLSKKLKFITHVASLAGTGPPLKFELERKAREGNLYPELKEDPAKQVAKLKQDFAAIRKDPFSTTKLAIGHTHVYWSGRLDLSAMKILSRSEAKIFLAHGTADQNVSFENFRLMLEELRRHKRDVTAMQVDGADHGFRVAAAKESNARDAWPDVIAAIGDWFRR